VAPKGRAVTAVLKPVAAALRSLELEPGAVVVSAVSGGADSVALTHALAALRSRFHFDLVAAHLNHGLRGTEADRDEHFVRDLCERLGVELVTERASGLKFDAPNLEERARELRYAFLNRAADSVNARCIALAHHADDQAETILMRLLRGSGASGLAAMTPRGPGRLFRPLLGLSRAALIAYLEAIGATWVTDQSNASPRILRNRLRGELLPLLEREFAPGVSARLVELGDEMRALDEFVSKAARAELIRRRDGSRLNLASFDELNPALAHSVLREFIRSGIGSLRRVSRDHILAMLRLCVGRKPSGRVVLPGRWCLRREYQFAVLERFGSLAVANEPFAVALDPRGSTAIPASGVTFESRLMERSSGEHGVNECKRLPAKSMEALFDVDELTGPLVVRNFAPGDRIALLGMTGTRKLQDLFVDRKLERDRRSRWPLVVAEDQILWVPWIARSRIALITAATKRVQWLCASTIASPATINVARKSIGVLNYELK
jgi:tRNA(Ile)-lysidine synthase